RALERLAEVAARRLVVEELRAAMGTHVVEGPQLAVAIPDDENRLADDVPDEVVARRRHLVRPADAHPALEEEALALLLVDGLARVVGAGQRRARAPTLAVADARAFLGDHGRPGVSGCAGSRDRPWTCPGPASA